MTYNGGATDSVPFLLHQCGPTTGPRADVALLVAASSAIKPTGKKNEGKFNIPGWNSAVKSKHQIAKAAFRLWVNCKRPKTGDIYRNMTKTKKDFKYSLRQCRTNAEMHKANGLAAAPQADKTKKSFSQKVNNKNRFPSLLLRCLSLCDTQAPAVNLIHAVLCDVEGVTQARGC